MGHVRRTATRTLMERTDGAEEAEYREAILGHCLRVALVILAILLFAGC